MTKSHSELVVQIEDGPQFRFRSWEKLEKWIDHERLMWEWVWLSRTDNIGNVINISRTAIENLKVNFDQLRAQEADLTTMDGPIQTAFAQATHNGLFHSESILGNRILAIRQQLGNDPAIFALAYARIQVSIADARKPSYLSAAMMLALPELLPVSALAKSLTSERTNYRTAARSMIDSIEASEEKRNADALAAVQRLRLRYGIWARRGLKLWASEFRDWQQARVDAIESIKTVEASYREAMALQAPVQYWKDKAKMHKEAESKAQFRLIIFFPISTITLGFIFGYVAQFLLDSVNKDVPQAL